MASCFAARGADVAPAKLRELPPTGPQPVVVSPQGRHISLYAESHALLISASNYQGGAQGWRTLPETGKELDLVAEALRKHGFAVWRVSDPTSDELTDYARGFFAKFGRSANNRLVIFYSGHGYTDPETQTGYLVPVNALHPLKDEYGFYSKALPIETIQTWAKELTARHVLFLFDSCFSGSIFMTKGSPLDAEDRGESVSDRWRFLTEKASKPVRQFIAAGGPAEELPAKSVFVPLFVEALEGKASAANDGYVSGKEIGHWLEQRVPEFNRTQSPHSDVIRVPELSFGDIIFQTGVMLPTAPVPPKPPTPPPLGPGPLVPPEFKLFGESIRIVYVAERKNDANALERDLRNMYAKVTMLEVWSVPDRFRNRIVSRSSKMAAAKTLEQVAIKTTHLDVLEQTDQYQDELIIWLGAR